jgi:hypothetical protein
MMEIRSVVATGIAALAVLSVLPAGRVAAQDVGGKEPQGEISEPEAAAGRTLDAPFGASL